MKRLFYLFAVIGIMTLGFLSGCSNDDDDPSDPNKPAVNSCEGCHTNYTHLKQVYTPDSTSGGSSCGGETPHVEPYDRVYIGGEGYTEFKKSEHYKMGCVKCHNGTDGTDNKKVAHSGNFISKPSTAKDEKCKSCHQDEVMKTHNSLHEQGWGQKRKVTVRYGLAGAHEFDKLPKSVKDGYKENCAKCHAATCGDCHVNRPIAQGGGLRSGHNFFEPDMLDNCIGCHTSRGGHAFLGVAPGTVQDVHKSKGMKCTSCHTKDEIHGTGEFVEQRYKYNKLPTCEKCHSNIAQSNTYHIMHGNNLTCQTCHSQAYNNCGSCHIGGDGARIASYQDFKIGVNPIKDAKSKYKLSLVRHTLMAPDSWSKYGVANLANFNAFPVYNYTTPHNILRWTPRTKVNTGEACSAACHISNENGTAKNKQWYLFESDLKYDWEKSSSKSVTVDGQLPSSWFNK